MRHALAAEVMLLRCRHAVWGILIVALAATAFFSTQTIREMAPPTAAQQVQAQEEYQTDIRWWEANHVRLAELCVADGGTPEQCVVPRPQAEQYLPAQVSFTWTSKVVLLIAAALMSLALFTAGAAFAGAEFASGVMTTWHGHLPSRSLLVASKLITITGLAVVTSIVTFGIALAAVSFAASTWEVPLTQSAVTTATLSALRGTVLVTLSAILGAATAFLTRRATVAVGLALGYVIINRLIASYDVATGVTPVLDLVTQAEAWVSGGLPLTFWDASGPQEVYVPAIVGLVSWSSITLVMVLIAFFVHRRRDLA